MFHLSARLSKKGAGWSTCEDLVEELPTRPKQGLVSSLGVLVAKVSVKEVFMTVVGILASPRAKRAATLLYLSEIHSLS